VAILSNSGLVSLIEIDNMFCKPVSVPTLVMAGPRICVGMKKTLLLLLQLLLVAMLVAESYAHLVVVLMVPFD